MLSDPLTHEEMQWLANFLMVTEVVHAGRDHDLFVDELLPEFPELEASMPRGLIQKLEKLKEHQDRQDERLR